jgi:hypothetical protein
MIGNEIISRSPGNLCNYALNEEKDANVLASHGVRTWSAGEMAADFEAQQRLRPGLNTATLHVALAWPPQEQARMTDELMRELTLAYLKKMDIDATKTQWAVVRHYDRDHPHCHLLINRVTNDGKVLSDSKSFERSEEACRALEKEYGLVDAGQLGIADTLKKAQDGKLSPYETARAYIHEAVSRHLPAATTVAELTKALATEGITMHGTYQDKKLLTVVFEREGEFVKGSALGKEFGGKRLGETLEKQQLQAQKKEIARQQQEKKQAEATSQDTLREKIAPDSSAEKSPQLPTANKPGIPVTAITQLKEPTSIDSIPLTGPPVTPVPSRETGKEAAVAVGQAAAPAQPAPPASTPETAPVAPPPSEAQRQASIFRGAAAGEWDSLDQAKDLVRQMLTKALITTETVSVNIAKAIEKQGFDFNQKFTHIRHQESKLIVPLADVQPGGPKALPFVKQVVAVAQANHMALAQQATIAVVEKFVQDKPHFIDREELTEQLRKVGLAVSWLEEVAGTGKGGKLTLTHVALGYSFGHDELTIHGKPLLPQIEALSAANWRNPERSVQIHYRDEAQAAIIKADLVKQGVRLLAAEPGSERAFVASYRLDSNSIDQIDFILKKINGAAGSHVVESGAATKQRADKALDCFINKENAGNTNQRER